LVGCSGSGLGGEGRRGCPLGHTGDGFREEERKRRRRRRRRSISQWAKHGKRKKGKPLEKRRIRSRREQMSKPCRRAVTTSSAAPDSASTTSEEEENTKQTDWASRHVATPVATATRRPRRPCTLLAKSEVFLTRSTLKAAHRKARQTIRTATATATELTAATARRSSPGEATAKEMGQEAETKPSPPEKKRKAWRRLAESLEEKDTELRTTCIHS